MIIQSAEFIKSAVTPDQFPKPGPPEIAFAGRSNSGKSSLINSLLGRRKLAKTSAEAGKTRLINFFLINNGFYFVDLPGYGYAKASHKERQEWKPMIENYASSRATLKGMIITADIRREAAIEERMLCDWLSGLSIPAIWILSKADKLSRNEQCKQQMAFSKALSIDGESVLVYSAKTGQGKDALWGKMPAIFLVNLPERIR